MVILLTHWVADFLCQSHTMAINKSKSVKWLTYHVLTYSLVTTIMWGLIGYESGFEVGLKLFGITFVTHWITDFFTSKWTSYLWAKESVHNFFVVIGLDQLIHMVTLLMTYSYLFDII